MPKPGRQEKAEGKRADFLISNMDQAMGKFLANNRREFQAQLTLEQWFVMEDESLVSQADILRVYLDPELSTSLNNFFCNEIGIFNDLAITRNMFEQASAPKTPMETLLREKGLSYFRRAEDLTPFADMTRGGDFFEEVAAMDIPLTDEDLETLDEVFVAPEDPGDVMLCLYFGVSAMATPSMWNKKSGAKRVEEQVNQKIDHIQDVAKTYLLSYSRRLFYQRYFPTTHEDIPTFPDGSLMPLVLAGWFAQNTSILPHHFANLIQEDFFPGLTEESKQVLTSYYLDHFATKFDPEGKPNRLSAKADDASFFPYELSMRSAENGEGTAYLTKLIEEYNQTHKGEKDREHIDWLLEHFSLAQKFTTDIITTLGTETDVSALDAFSYRKGIIDFTVVSDTDVAYTIQIDFFGYIIGLPKELQVAGMGYVNMLVSKLREKIEATTQQRRQVQTQEESGGMFDIPAPKPTNETKIDRDERMKRYAEAKARQTFKRKALRDAGLLPPLDQEEDEEEEEKKETATERRIITRAFFIDLSYSELYTLQRKGLPDKRQRQLDEILQLISTNAIYARKHLKPLSEEDPDYAGLKAYTVRLGLGYRVKLVQGSERGKMMVTKVEPRGKAYDDLEGDYAQATQEQSS